MLDCLGSLSVSSSVASSVSGSYSYKKIQDLLNNLNDSLGANITFEDIYTFFKECSKFNFPMEDLNEKIVKFWKYEIGTLDEDAQGWADFGINVLNFFASFNDERVDYPYHWFLIGVSEKDKHYLIEKTDEGKSINYFRTESEARKEVERNYPSESSEFLETHYLKRNYNIKDIFNGVKSLPDGYDLYNNNCQDFVRDVINKYC